MGAAALAGRDKVTIVASPAIASFGAWAEQLIAESTGKQGKGLVPVDGEPVGVPAVYGHDRFFLYLRLDGHAEAAQDEALRALERDGHPIARITLDSIEQLPQEFYRLEMATAVAGAVLGINPFDQPDVEASKVETKKLFAEAEANGALPAETPLFADETRSPSTPTRGTPRALKQAAEGLEAAAEGAGRPAQGRRLSRAARLRAAQRARPRASSRKRGSPCATPAG